METQGRGPNLDLLNWNFYFNLTRALVHLMFEKPFPTQWSYPRPPAPDLVVHYNLRGL